MSRFVMPLFAILGISVFAFAPEALQVAQASAAHAARATAPDAFQAPSLDSFADATFAGISVPCPMDAADGTNLDGAVHRLFPVVVASNDIDFTLRTDTRAPLRYPL